jgi:threonine dehydrogenase-like Zn-dependent dehydrogenase
MGVVEEVGSDVKKVKAGQRYVCCFDIGCGDCFYCKHNLYSCCMRSNPSNMTCGLYGHKLGGFYGTLCLWPFLHTCVPGVVRKEEVPQACTGMVRRVVLIKSAVRQS